MTRLHTEDGRTRLVVSAVLLLIAAGVLALIGNQNLGFYMVPSSSMEPTLMPDDRVVAWSSDGYERGEVVVVRDPNDKSSYLVKRIVALPGDRVQVLNGQLYVNDTPVEEPYVKEGMEYRLDPTWVRDGEVFLLGDNRNFSEDSHIWKHGLPMEDIMGSVLYIYAPNTRRGNRVDFRETFASLE